MSQWYGLFAPAKTPKVVVDRLNKELNATLAERNVVKKIEEQGADVETSSPEQMKSLVQRELTRWRGVVAAAKIKAD